MAKAAPKAKKAPAKTARAKAETPVEPKAKKATAKPAAKAAPKAAEKPAEKAAVKAPSRTAKAKRVKAARGDQFHCEVCGLVVSIDEPCGCVEACDIICCDQQMQPRK